jgi:hypothetical protein
VIFGFNTDVRVGKQVYHVQTEDRGPTNPVIDTTIYTGGRVVHKRANSYREFLESAEFNEAALRERLELQHRGIIEELRRGDLQFSVPDAQPAVPRTEGIIVQLLNPASWLSKGTATLKVGVRTKGEEQPVAGAHVQVSVTAADGPLSFAAPTDADGQAEISFPMPRSAAGGTELVIRAAAAPHEDEIRYQLRPKPKPVAG